MRGRGSRNDIQDFGSSKKVGKMTDLEGEDREGGLRNRVVALVVCELPRSPTALENQHQHQQILRETADNNYCFLIEIESCSREIRYHDSKVWMAMQDYNQLTAFESLDRVLLDKIVLFFRRKERNRGDLSAIV